MDIDVGVISGRIDLDEVYREIMESTSRVGGGAIVSFIGYVKGLVDDKKVYELEYSVYEPYTSAKLKEIAVEEYKKYNLLAVRIYHRVGRLKPGEPTVYIIVAARGRREAFEAAREILERVKREPPIFKLEKREDGEYWIIGDHRRVKRRK
jgi:molybdopterin synthase catalytic subunit